MATPGWIEFAEIQIKMLLLLDSFGYFLFKYRELFIGSFYLHLYFEFSKTFLFFYRHIHRKNGRLLIHATLHVDMLCYSCFIRRNNGVNGSHGYGSSLRVVPIKQRRDSFILVRHTIPSNVLTLGSSRIQRNCQWRRRHGIGRNPGGTSLLFLVI